MQKFRLLHVCPRMYIINFSLSLGVVAGLENGLGRTPPMGFISWERFGAEIDCTKFPDTCISERLYMEMADAIVSTGLREAGYVYVNIDDNWSSRTRGADGRLVEDSKRFPNGMKKLADYIHSKELLFGMYTDVGTTTCQGYPGLENLNHMGRDDLFFESDIDMFLDWGIDALKVDGCNANINEMVKLYPSMSMMIQRKIAERKNARQILLSCSWPAYLKKNRESGKTIALLQQHCNLWRNYSDIEDSWASVQGIVSFFARRTPNDPMVRAAGPGHWNDPDMLVIGNPGLSLTQQQTQMSIWAILAAPLYISSDIRTISADSLQILLNGDVIKVNQDPLGRQGWVVSDGPVFRIWVRPLHNQDIAVLVENKRASFGASVYTLKMDLFVSALKNPMRGSFKLKNLVDDKVHGPYEWDKPVRVKVDESCSKLFRVSFN